MLELEIRPGKFLHLILSVLPAGDIANTIWRLFLVLSRKKFHISSFVSGMLSCFASGRILSYIVFFYSSSNRAGTIPIVIRLLISSKNPYSMTWASVNMKRTGPSQRYPKRTFRSSLNSFSLYPLVRVIVKMRYLALKAERRVRDCLPEPP